MFPIEFGKRHVQITYERSFYLVDEEIPITDGIKKLSN
jgi:hypothetical protein